MSIEKTDEQYAIENEQIYNMFPDAKFTISIDIDELDYVITTQEHIIIKSAYTCYCYDNCNKKTEFFNIFGKNITNKFIINSLIKQDLNLDCNHHFIEGFYKNPKTNSDCQFEIMTGS